MFVRRYKWPLLFLGVLVCVFGLVDHIIYQGSLRTRIFSSSSKTHAIFPRLAIVDMAKIHEESAPFKALHNFLETRYSQTEQQIFNTENELRQEYKELSEQEKMLERPDEAITKRRQDFQKKVQHLEQDVLDKKNKFNEQFQSIKIKVEDKLHDILRDLAVEKGVNFVLNRSLGPDVPVVLFSSQAFDMTPEVIERLNKIKEDFDIPLS